MEEVSVGAKAISEARHVPAVNVAAPSSGDLTVAELMARQAARTPHAIALSAGREVLTYQEVDQRANQLAHYLRELGVGPEKLVGICLRRSPAMVIAALATMKAGGAYLPLDETLPPSRLRFMLEDAGACVLLSRSDLHQNRLHGSWHLLDCDAEQAAISAHPVHDPGVVSHAGQLAYVIFTSGSTGQPKGVEITHASLRNLIQWHIRAFHVTASDRASHQANLGFDAAVWEVWPYLTVGASVLIPDDKLRTDPEQMRNWLVDNKITITFLPTPLAEHMIALEWPNNTALRTLLTGGDVLRHRPRPGLPFSLVNNYGPTEFTVVATSAAVAPSGPGRLSAPSIGVPIDQAQAYILDEQMKPAADGTVGDLYLGGAGLARGYRNHPELTAKMFVRNPFSAGPGSRLYRTGDRVRRLAGGELEFLGRSDEQIKIRGHRIEPEEISAALNSHPQVRSTVVIADEGAAGEKRLIAYVVTTPETKLSAAQLQEHLRPQLPSYMIPAAFVKIDRLPVSSNGKVDRKALPAPNAQNLIRDESPTPPGSIVEDRLAAVIAPLLGVKQVNSDDNFFLLGGHSLLGTRLLAKIRETFGVDLTLLSLFDHPTLGEMSAQIEHLILEKIAAQHAGATTPSASAPASARGITQ